MHSYSPGERYAVALPFLSLFIGRLVFLAKLEAHIARTR